MVEAPLVLAVLGGLASPTILCLVVLPAVVQWMAASRFEHRMSRRDESAPLEA